MIEFNVQDMTCGHCVSTITKAVNNVDPAAKVDIDLGHHAVRINNETDAKRIEDAIRDAGFTPVKRS